MHSKHLWFQYLLGSTALFLLSFTLQAQTTDEVSLKAKLLAVAGRLGVSRSDIEQAIIAKSFVDKGSGIRYVYLQQTHKNIPVYNQLMTIAFKNDSLVHAAGRFLQKGEKPALPPAAVISAAEAIVHAARHLGLPLADKLTALDSTTLTRGKKLLFSSAGIAKRNIEVQLYWAADTLQQLHLAWNVNIDVKNRPDWWNVRIDARTGDFVKKDNWTVYEQAQNSEAKAAATRRLSHATGQYLAPPPNDVSHATYYVIPFPADNLNQTNFETVTDPWLDAGAGNNATTYGWHYNGTTTYNITRGNNVYAYNDSAASNAPGLPATSVTPLPNLTFNSIPDFEQSTSLTSNKYAAITNLFYWNNLMHDVMYQYGFDEAAGNFQVSNLGRGGKGTDPVLAEAQDGSGTNNANFSTPEDGSSGRMQMYLWNAVKPPLLVIQKPEAIAGSYNNVESGFSTANQLINVGPLTDTLALYTRDSLACTDTLLPTNIKGKIALIYRGSCNFTVKVKNAQKAGAVGVIMINTQGSDLITMGGTDNSITIPAVLISYEDGRKISSSVTAGNTVTATLTGSPLLDGDFDNGIICHEYGHGISHRLTGGNVSCLDNAEKADEGWSDYFALMMTQNWKTTTLADSGVSRSIGTYVFGQSNAENGIRTYPYSTNMTINPHTYANVSKNDGEVHYIGEVWCAALWDMTWGIIRQEGAINPNLYDANGSGGNVIALRLVMEGEKLQPCSPGFLDSRDAILAADSILYNGRHKCTIWNAFARRGMGISAVQGSAFKINDQKAAFDVPVLQLRQQTLPVIADQLTTRITVSCECMLPPAGYLLKDTLPSGFTLAGSDPQTTVQGNIVTFDASNFTALGQQNEYTLTLRPDADAGCTRDTVVYDNRDNRISGGFTSTAARGNTQWTNSTAKAYSSATSWFALESGSPADFSLVSSAFVPTQLSVLSFRHFLETESGYDGGMIDISTNNGSSWTSAAPYFIQNGYNGAIFEYKPADTSYGTTAWPAFTGSLTDSAFVQSSVNLSSFAGKSIKIRFRMYTDLGTSYRGWYVDDITVTNGCGGVQGIGLYNNAGKVIGAARVVNFNTDSSGVVQPAFADFTATAVNNMATLLNWSTIAETSVASFVVERSTDSLTFTTLTTVTATGSSSSNYTYTDNSPENGTNYYRIRMIDGNGSTVETSPVRAAAFNRYEGLITIVPNPAVSRAILYLTTDFNAKQVVVYDMQGRKVYAANVTAGATMMPLNTGGFSAGVYLVQVISATNELKTLKLMVTR